MTAVAGSDLTDLDSDQPALQCEGIRKAFGGHTAVDGATFSVPRGKISALIGPNGAGTTTVVSIMSGALPSDAGTVMIGGVDATGWPSHKVARLGLIRTFQLSRELGGLTVLENLLVTPASQAGESLFNIYFRPRQVRREERANVARALDILNTYGLYELRDNWARELSGGQKRLLELARAVMARPRLLLLDEPMAGINPALIDQIGEHILGLKTSGVSVLMVEHNLAVVEQICDHVLILAEGRTLAAGRLSELRDNTDVVRAYLGGVLDARLDR